MPLNLTRSLLTIILPGMVALGPWLLLILMWIPDLGELYRKFNFPFHIVAFGLSVVVGSIFEEVGNYLEKRWDQGSSKEPPEFDDGWVNRAWYVYLCKVYGNGEPVAYRYLSRKVTALYFELGMMFATPVALLALALLVVEVSPGRAVFAFAIGILAAVLSIAMWKSAKHTHQLLCEVRYFVACPPASVKSLCPSD